MRMCAIAQADDLALCKLCCHECPKYILCDSRCESPKEDCQDLVIESDLVQIEKAVPNAITIMTTNTVKIKELQDQIDKLKTDLIKAMEKYGVKSIENDQVSFTYVAPTTRTTVDNAKLKKEYAEVYADCQKTTPISASVRITVKK